MAKAKKLPSGSWRVLVYSHTDINKKRHYESFTASTKREAEYQAAKFAHDRKRLQSGNMTVQEAMTKYIESKDGVLSPTTISGYRKMAKYQLQSIMNVPLKSLTSEMVQLAVNEDSKKNSERTGKPVSAKTIRNAHGLLSAALSVYHPDLRLSTTLPAKVKTLKELPDVEELLSILHGSEIELQCLLALWLSFTRSEIRGLKGSSISKGKTISIKGVLVDVDGKEIYKEQAKEYNRRRTLELPDYLFQLINENEAYKRYLETGEDEFLFTEGALLNDHFKKLQEDNGFTPRITFHQLRHLNASIMLQLGVPDKYAMERGGWGTDNTLKEVYQHTFSSERKQIDKKINDYFDNKMQHEMQHDE